MNNIKIQAFLKIGCHFADEIAQLALVEIIKDGARWQPSLDTSEMILEMIGLAKLLLRAVDEDSLLGTTCLAACLHLVHALLENKDWILGEDSEVSEGKRGGKLTELKITVGAMLKAVLGMHQHQALLPELSMVDDVPDDLDFMDGLQKVAQWADDFLAEE